MTKARASLWYLCCLESINLTYVLGHIVITLKGCTKPVEAGEVGISECGKVDQSLAIMPGMHWIPEPHVGAVTMKSIVLISQAGSLFISCNRLNIMISVLPTYWRVSSCSSYNSLRVPRGIIASCDLVYTGSCPLSFNHHIMATNPDMIEKLVWEADGCSLYPDPPTSKWSSIELAGHVGTFLTLPGVHQHHHHHSTHWALSCTMPCYGGRQKDLAQIQAYQGRGEQEDSSVAAIQCYRLQEGWHIKYSHVKWSEG